MANLKGIDVSKWQGTINWADVKKEVDFAIIKCGGNEGGYYKDQKFELNYSQANAVGLPLGCYFYTGSNFTSEEQGLEDAKKFYEYIKEKAFLCHVWVDIEEVATGNQANVTKAALAFIKYMEEKDFPCGIYASDVSGFVDRLDRTKLSGVKKWVARYGSQPKFATDWVIWQTGSTGKVLGISGNVDTNEALETLFETKKVETKVEVKTEVKTTAASTTFLPSRGYWQKGDNDVRVGRLCTFYYNTFPAYADALGRDKKNLIGNLFGDNCEAWTKEFQKRTLSEAKEYGLTEAQYVDGKVGKVTYAILCKYGFRG